MRRTRGTKRRDRILKDALEAGNVDGFYTDTENTTRLLAGYSRDAGMHRAARLFEEDLPKKRGRRR